MNCVLVPHIRSTSAENSVPAAVGGERERRGRRLQLDEEECQKVVEEGEKMGGVHTECGMQSVACS